MHDMLLLRRPRLFMEIKIQSFQEIIEKRGSDRNAQLLALHTIVLRDNPPLIFVQAWMRFQNDGDDGIPCDIIFWTGSHGSQVPSAQDARQQKVREVFLDVTEGSRMPALPVEGQGVR